MLRVLENEPPFYLGAAPAAQSGPDPIQETGEICSMRDTTGLKIEDPV
jgi:hypothetical protein